MKRLAALLLCGLLLFSMCGCSIKDILGGAGKTVSEIAEKTGILNETGILVDNVNGDEVKTIEPVATGSVGKYADCYKALNDSQQTKYRYIKAAAENMTDGWFFCGNAGDSFETDIAISYKAMLCDNPQIFWMPASYLISIYKGKLCVAFSINEKDIKNDYLLSKEEVKSAASALDLAVNNLVNQAKGLDNDYQKELFIHDYFCENVAYNLEGGDMIYTSYGALVEKNCVCEGYSRAMQLCLLKLGIDCTLCYGEYENTGHMWNKVKLDGDWYNTDVTWDKNDKYGALHKYFNLTDSEIKEDHIVSALYSADTDYKGGDSFNILMEPCNSSNYNYFVIGNRYLKDDANSTADAIYSEYANGKKYAELLDVSTGDVGEALNSAAYELRDRLKLTSYAKIGNEVIVFFENIS